MIKVIEELIKREEYQKAKEQIDAELSKNIFHEEMYFYLGNIYEGKGEYNRAYLCYEHALSIRDNSKYKELIKAKKEEMIRDYNIDVRKVSIILLTYNNLEYTKICIDSIRKYSDLNSCEIIVVDNNSTDETKKWLMEQNDIKVILNEKNEGFPKGCNQGIEIAEKENDIFLLNNDTVVMPNSIFNLRMALYSDESIGATGSVSNKVSNHQQIKEVFKEFDEYMDYAIKNNINDEDRYEQRIKLVGFAMLIKRSVLDEVGVLDERFTPGNYEDDDLSFRILNSGHKLLLCKDSYIHHFGSVSFNKDRQAYLDLLETNLKKFEDKWKFNCNYSCYVRYDLLELMKGNKDEHINVLEIGCASGATLLEIKNRYPNSNLYGIELNEYAAAIGKNFADITAADIENSNLDYEEGFFDYIILGDVLEHLVNPQKVLEKMKPYLKDTGSVLTSIPNVMHYSIVYDLMRGNWTYRESGILDRTHLRFFTKNEILKMFDSAEYYSREMDSVESFRTAESEHYVNMLMQISGNKNQHEYYTVQYVNKIMKLEFIQKVTELLNKVEADMDNKELINELGVLINKGYIDESMIIKIVNENSIDKINMFNFIAIYLFENRYIDMIIPLLNEAYEINPSNMDTNYNLAYVLYCMGESDLALRYLDNIKVPDEKVDSLRVLLK